MLALALVDGQQVIKHAVRLGHVVFQIAQDIENPVTRHP